LAEAVQAAGAALVNVPSPVVLVMMGVSGCGKSTVAEALADRLGWEFQEGDALHPAANVAKMAAGHPLNDVDRAPWLQKVAEWIESQLDAGKNGIITCSSLRKAYRDVLNRRGSGVEFVYLYGSRELIAERLDKRHGHFMPAELLDSQFATLEEPELPEPFVRVNAGPAADVIAKEVTEALGLDPVAG
jgi:gluconokinase